MFTHLAICICITFSLASNFVGDAAETSRRLGINRQWLILKPRLVYRIAQRSANGYIYIYILSVLSTTKGMNIYFG